MPGTIKRFGFRIAVGPRPVVHVTLASRVVLGDGEIALTPGLTDAIDAYIDLLQADLEAAGQRAKAALSRATEMASVSVVDTTLVADGLGGSLSS